MNLEQQISAGLVRAGAKVEAKLGSVVRLDDQRRPPFSTFCTLNASGHPRFTAPLLGAYIIERTPVAVGGGQLYVYQRGVYREGEQGLRHLTTELLGNEWNRSRAEETIAWLRARAPHLNEEPPTNQVNVRNGIIVLKANGRVELRPHNPKQLSPIQLPIWYDPAAKCPRVNEFLKQVFREDDMVVLVHEIAGHLLVPDNSYQRAFMLHGAGGNGKSRVLGLLSALIGVENISSRQLQDLDDNRFACADLYGKLANICADISSRELQSSSKFKAITGGDRIAAERKHQPAFDFKPFARLLFSANEIPTVSDGSRAFFDRWIILPCHQDIRGSEMEDKDILQKLTSDEELSGFLNLALAGLARLRQRRGRFTLPIASNHAHWQFRTNADSVAGFVSVDPPRKRGWVKKSELYLRYQNWCLAAGQQPLSSRKFYPRYQELVPLREARRRGSDGYVLLPNGKR